MIKPWPVKSSRKLGSYRVFDIRSDLRQSPRTGKEHEFFVLEAPGWVNVIALTPQGDLVMIEQFRHGSNSIELEIPGGVMDQSDGSPEVCGTRELREETGYEGEKARVIGRVFSNPAIMNNTCYTVLVENCRLNHPVEFDHAEDIISRLVHPGEIPDLIRRGRIAHSLVVAALFHYELLKRAD